MMDINAFNDVEFLEQKCPKCRTVLDFGNNTEYSDMLGTHVCLKCKTPL